MSVVVYNTNRGYGTFNNVSGNQVSTNNNIIAFYGPSRRDDHFVDEPVTITNERYHLLLCDIAFVRARFAALRELWPRDSSISASCEHLDEFARIFAFTARAFEVIVDIPSAAKSLRFFERIRILIDQCQSQFAKIREEITFYHEVQLSLTSSFWRMLFAFIYAIYFWCPMIKRLQILLSSHRKTLQRFLRFLTTSAWRSLIPAQHARELDHLIHQAGLYEDSVAHDVEVQKILVIDHLGRRLVVPIEFCTSWPDFDLLVKHYCRGVIGSEFVQRNAWEIIHGQSDRVISIRNFTQAIQPGMLLEMSIVLWKQSSPKKVCPRCEYDNSDNNEYSGWIECHRCSKRFQIRSPRSNLSSNEIRGNGNGRKQLESFMEMMKHPTQIFGRSRPRIELNNEPAILDIDPTPINTSQTSQNEIHHFNRITVRVQEILLHAAASSLPSSHAQKLSYRPPITTTSEGPLIQYPRLMSQHQMAQGYTPSLRSTFPSNPFVPPVSLPPLEPNIELDDARYDEPPSYSPDMPSKLHSPLAPPLRPGDKPSPPPDREPQNSYSGLKTINFPLGTLPRFLEISETNTKMNRETCGLLLGKSKGHPYVVTTLLIPKQHSTSETCTMEEEELILQFMEARDLITLGWIHTHPSQTCFMTSDDLHTLSALQRILPESFAVVCAPKSHPNFGIFRLTDPPGLQTILRCDAKETFHSHPDIPIYTDADTGHVQIKEIPFEMVDLR